MDQTATRLPGRISLFSPQEISLHTRLFLLDCFKKIQSPISKETAVSARWVTCRRLVNWFASHAHLIKASLRLQKAVSQSKGLWWRQKDTAWNRSAA